jgi:hypothetical protein
MVKLPIWFDIFLFFFTLQVVNDGDMYLWRELGVNSWPTFAIVGPNGKLLAQISGEGRRQVPSKFCYGDDKSRLVFFSKCIMILS